MTGHTGEKGFSLVEIAIALGIFGFAAIAILVLLSASVNSGQASQQDTVLSTMTGQMISQLQREHFHGTIYSSGTTAVLCTGTIGIFPGTSGSSIVVTSTTVAPAYFDDSGNRIFDPATGQDPTRTVALTQGAIYQCTAILQSDTNTLTAAASSGTANLMNVELYFAWPVPALAASTNPPANAPNSRIVYTSIARY